MRWNKVSLKSSLQSLLGQKSATGKPGRGRLDDRARLEGIRQAMLGALDDAGMEGYEHVARRLGEARDIEALWFLRADLMHALSHAEGEPEARRRMARITPLFHGLVSSGLHSRASPLGDRAESL